MSLAHHLTTRDTPIRVGLIGAGIFGSQVLYATEQTDGMEMAGVADIDTDIARNALIRAGVSTDQIATASTREDVIAVLANDERVIAPNGSILITDAIDVIVDATGVPDAAAKHAVAALSSGTHFVNVSVEADTVVGPFLSQLADANNVSYSLAFGDQPAQIVELCNWATSTGLEVVATGRTTGGMEPHGTPDDALERHSWIDSFTDTHDPDPKIYNSFLDGTKLAVESCSAANALDLAIDTPGMHQPQVRHDSLPDQLCLAADGGLLSESGVVDAIEPKDYSVSVFVVTKTDNPHRQAYYPGRSGVSTAVNGKYQAFIRPYHMAPETTVSIARTVLRNEPTGAPVSHRAEVIGAAKRDLDTGETLDGGGGYTAYGVVVSAEEARSNGYVPIELLDEATVSEPIGTDEFISYDAVSLPDSFIRALRRVQDELV